MAGRTGIGIGLGSFITILSITWVGLFVTTVVFMAGQSRANRMYKSLQEQNDQYITESEIASDDVKQIQSVATRGNKSLVKHLMDSQRETMRLATGNEKMTIEGLQQELERAGARNSNLLQVLRDRNLDLTNTKKQAEDAIKARDQAMQDRENEVARVAAIASAHEETMEANRASVALYKNEVDAHGAEIDRLKQDAEVRIEGIRADFQDQLAATNAQISDLERQLVISRGNERRLQAELKGKNPTIDSEMALVDGGVIGLDSAENNVYINIGAKQKVKVGMSFEVYSEATAIRPDPTTGDYPAGKASIEVLKVDGDSAVARVTREKRGNPVIKGDVIANAVYDPNKVYTMLVYGNFDANRDGVATQQEASSVRVLIEEWGGKVVNALEGNVDFLVLGQKPVIPPAPPEGSPGALIQEYIRVKRIADQYDELLRQAQSTSLPVLNENRLYTLIGKGRGI